MRVIIFDGENVVIKRQKVTELQRSFEREAISQFSLKSMSFDQLLVEIRTPSFFSSERLIIVEEVEEKKIEIGALGKDEAVTLVLLINRELSAAAVTKLKSSTKGIKLEIVSFAQPQDKSIFQFLDLLGERKEGQVLEAVDKLYSQFGGQYLLTMLLYFLRRMVLPAKGAGFGAEKIMRQKSNFSKEKIRRFYKEVLETEFLIKTGRVEEKTAFLLLIKKILN